MANVQHVGGASRVPDATEISQVRERPRQTQPEPRKVESPAKSEAQAEGNTGRTQTPRRAAAQALLKSASVQQSAEAASEVLNAAKEFVGAVRDAQNAPAENPEAKAASTARVANAVKTLEDSIARNRLEESFRTSADEAKQSNAPAVSPDGRASRAAPAPEQNERPVADRAERVAAAEARPTKQNTPSGAEESHFPQAANAQAAPDAAKRPKSPELRPTQEPAAQSDDATAEHAAPTASPASRPAVSLPSLGDALYELTHSLTAQTKAARVDSYAEHAERAVRRESAASSKAATSQPDGPADPAAKLSADQARAEQSQQRSLDAAAQVAAAVAEGQHATDPQAFSATLDQSARTLESASTILRDVIRPTASGAGARSLERNAPRQPNSPAPDAAQRIVQAVVRPSNNDSLRAAQTAPQPKAVAQLLM